MDKPMSDAFSIRVNLSEASVWLAAIFSWATPYAWYTDVAIIVAVIAFNVTAVKNMRVEDSSR